jgi:hypothetical protein
VVLDRLAHTALSDCFHHPWRQESSITKEKNKRKIKGKNIKKLKKKGGKRKTHFELTFL